MLTLFRTYKISKKSLIKFKKKGFSEPALENLASLEEQLFPTPEDLINSLKKLPNKQEILENEKTVLKETVGYFRLDNWISHKTTREWVEALIFALIVASIVRTFLFAPFKIPTGSMIPTIYVGDQIFATMYSYGIPVPFTDIKFFPQPIERGDIVIFPYPRDPSVDYIKRVIGLGGEEIKIVKDQVYIDGKPLEEPYAYYDTHFLESQQNMGIDPRTIITSPVSNFLPIKIPKGKIFVMGDNRYNSLDSRFWGFVDIKKVKGKAQVTYWSKVPIDGLMGWFQGYQLERIFHLVR